jgi:hypothetical protein
LANRSVFDVRRQYLRSKLTRGKLGKRLATRLSGQFYLDRGSDPADSVLLTGSARAGTTWISELINYRNDYRYIFEPFHPNRLPITKHFLPRQYIRPGNRDPSYLRPAEAILSGRVRSLWTDKYNRARFARKRLIKEVRGNLLLGWIHANFPETPIVLVLRHPCAVASSQLDLGWNWHLDLPDFLDQRDLVDDHLEPFADALARPQPPFEAHVLLWCVENYVPLRQFQPGDVHVVFYEDLCVAPDREIRRLFAFLGMPFEQEVMRAVRRPSAVIRKNSAIVSGGDLVASWRKYVGEDQVKRAIEILGQFGLDRIYSDQAAPRLETASEALAPA